MGLSNILHLFQQFYYYIILQSIMISLYSLRMKIMIVNGLDLLIIQINSVVQFILQLTILLKFLNSYPSMNNQHKINYGLKNASAFLHKFRRQKQYNHNFSHDTGNEKQRTFDSDEMPSSNDKESPEQLFDGNHKNENIVRMKKQSKIGKQKKTVSEQQPIGLADIVIKQHLQKTLLTYQQDLRQLEENRDNLIQSIEEVALKIKGLNDLQSKNQLLQLQNFKAKKQNMFLVRQYHELTLNLQRKKIKIQEGYLKKKEKIKSLMELFPVQNEYIIESQSWNQYYAELQFNKICQIQTPSQQKVNQMIFPKTEQGIENLKKKQKGKVVDKSALLGDLKNFAKNFKMPKNNQNDS